MPRKRESFLDRLIEKYPNDELLNELLKTLQTFFELLSIYQSSIDKKLFSDLFIARKQTCEIAEEHFIHKDTLSRYAHGKYSELAKKLIKADYLQGLKAAFLEDVNLLV